VFQPAVAIIHRIEHKHIVFVGRLGGVPEANFSFADFLRVGQQFRAIKCRWGPGHHETVWYATGLEGTAPERAHFHRAVGQLVVVGCQVSTKTILGDLDGRKACCHLPVFDGGA